MTQVDLENKSPNRDIFSVLAKEGTFKILEESESKLISKRETPQKLGLTKRQYYSRLRELKNLNIIKKEGEGYVRTEQGEKISKLAKGMCNLSENNIADSLLKPREIEKSQVKMITDYDSLAENTVKLLKNATEEALLASRYVDYRVVNSILEIDNNVTFKVIGHQFNYSASTELFSALTSIENLKKALNLYQNQCRIVEHLPYTFLVKDKTSALVEVVDPRKPNDFFTAFVLENEKICEELRSYFKDLFEGSDSKESLSNQVSRKTLEHS